MRFAPWWLSIAVAGCGADAGLRVTSGAAWHTYVRDRAGGAPSLDLDALRFRPGLCEEADLRPEYAKLDETSLTRFLERQRIEARLERPRADLLYLNIGGANTERPVRLRVAILANADEAGRELHEGILQHGPGSWGVRRSNLAVLGPVGSPGDDIAFVGATKLACWGVFTVAGTDDAFVLPGGYTEL